MKKNVNINVKNTKNNNIEKSVSYSALIISSQKVDKALEQRKKNNNEEFTEWK